MSVNSANILKVRDLILAHPDHFDMAYFGFNKETMSINVHGIEENRCGTVACIAGWAAIAADRQDAIYDGCVMEVAADFFGLDLDVARTLFLPGEDDGMTFNQTERAYAATPRQAAHVLETLAKTGEINWRDI
jgi:hypothetical protein